VTWELDSRPKRIGHEQKLRGKDFLQNPRDVAPEQGYTQLITIDVWAECLLSE
jgi:hypothetical protein